MDQARKPSERSAAARRLVRLRQELASLTAGLVRTLLGALSFWALRTGAQEQELSKADKGLMIDASRDLERFPV